MTAANAVIATHGPHTKRSDVRHGSAACRQRQRRKHTKEMRAAGDAVQDAHAERRVRMAETPRPRGTGVHVHVIVLDGAVMVGSGRNVQSSAERPETDRNQGNADDALSPCRENVDRRKQSRSRMASSATTTTPEA